MPSAAPPVERVWLAPALAIVLGIAALRAVLLAFDRLDLFVDEAQYWLWGRELAFGYYSKPPLVGWVVGLSTAIGGDGAFWVRLPGVLANAASALILARIAAETRGRAAALWVAAGFSTLPMVGVGSLLIGTDTIMFPFLALALWAWRRVHAGQGMRMALWAGIALGAGAMAKYAALYLIPGAAVAALWPTARPRAREAALALAAAALVLAPNVIWNALNGFPTLRHTLDNIDWVNRADDRLALRPVSLVRFLAAQLAVFGPLAVPLFLRRLTGADATDRLWAAFALPVLVLVGAEALLDRAYANWAAVAWLPGTLMVFAAFPRSPRLGAAVLGVNAAICLALPLATLAPAALTDAKGQPLLARYLGRATTTRAILSEVRAIGATAVVSADRDVLADLFYTGRDAGVPIYAAPPGPCAGDADDCARNHYQMTHPAPQLLPGPALYVGAPAPACVSDPPVAVLPAAPGTWQKVPLPLYRLPAGCWAR